jgi:methyltransferase family protein
MFPRTVAPETLDGLAASDVRALRARRDLQRLNRVIGTRGIIIKAMQPVIGGNSRDLALRVLELGAGDGTLMLSIAKKVSASWPAVHLTLLDRLAIVESTTSANFARLGWSVQTMSMDVFEWAAAPQPRHVPPRWDAIVTNHFLHHFDEPLLPMLLSAIADRCNLFAACEPRRAPLALVGSHLIGALGANRVTREDAVLSVHAGFRGAELSAAWPHDPHVWQLQEHAVGLFSHVFRAAKRAVAAPPTAYAI